MIVFRDWKDQFRAYHHQLAFFDRADDLVVYEVSLTRNHAGLRSFLASKFASFRALDDLRVGFSAEDAVLLELFYGPATV